MHDSIHVKIEVVHLKPIGIGLQKIHGHLNAIHHFDLTRADEKYEMNGRKIWGAKQHQKKKLLHGHVRASWDVL